MQQHNLQLKSNILRSALVFYFCVIVDSTVQADWPQWGGSSRDFKIAGKDFADSWPPSGLLQVWKRPLGDGYSGMAIARGTIITMYRKANHEHVIALETETGKTIWQHRYAAPFLPNTNLQPGPGPHATPLLVGQRVYAVGVTGILNCFDQKSGKVFWKHNLIKGFGGTVLFRGYSSSPIAYKDSVIVTVGGKGHAVVALRLTDGTVKWRKQDFAISHASPILINFKGQEQLVVFADKVFVGLNPADGGRLWKLPHPEGGGYIASMPVWGEVGRLFFSSAYGAGSRCIQLTQEGDKTLATQIWHNGRMRVHHSNVIRIGDYVYGSSGDFGAVVFTALNLKTGQVAWQDRRLTRASCVYVDGKFIVMEENGSLTLATMSPAGLEIHSKVPLFDGRAWTPPTIVGKRLYVRNREEIMAFKLP